MIPEWIEQRIIDLWVEGLSMRRIALLLHVARGTVLTVIASGGVRPRCESPCEPPPRQPLRCSVCGAEVVPPCVACETRRELACLAARPFLARARDRNQARDEDLRPQLHAGHQDRYERLRAAKMARGERPFHGLFPGQ